MIRVLHIGPKNYPPAHGGVEKSVYDITRHLVGVISHVAVEWDQPHFPNVVVLPRGLLRRFRRLLSYCRDAGIDVVHFNKEGFIPLALMFHWFTRYSTLITIRGCAWRLERWPFLLRVVFYLLDILACLFMPRVVFVGLRDFEHFSRVIPWRKFEYIPNGVEAHEWDCREARGDFVYVGRISPEKNIVRMIDAFSRVSGTLDIFGPFDKHDPDYRAAVLERIERTPNVTYRGVLSHLDIFPTLSNYRGFVSLSHSEGMPVAVLEAASVGNLLVLSDIKQHRDLAFEDVLYVDPERPCLCIDPSGIAFSRRNRDRAHSFFSLRATAARYMEIYEEFSCTK